VDIIIRADGKNHCQILRFGDYATLLKKWTFKGDAMPLERKKDLRVEKTQHAIKETFKQMVLEMDAEGETAHVKPAFWLNGDA
jgi:hypothetical protein